MSIIQEALRRKAEDEGHPLPPLVPPLPPAPPAKRPSALKLVVLILLVLALAGWALVFLVQAGLRHVAARGVEEGSASGPGDWARVVLGGGVEVEAPEPWAAPPAFEPEAAKPEPTAVHPPVERPTPSVKPLPEPMPAAPVDPGDEPASPPWPSLTIEAVLALREGGYVQFRNGPQVERGRTYRGVRVEAVAWDEVTLEFRGEQRTLRVGQSTD